MAVFAEGLGIEGRGMEVAVLTDGRGMEVAVLTEGRGIEGRGIEVAVFTDGLGRDGAVGGGVIVEVWEGLQVLQVLRGLQKQLSPSPPSHPTTFLPFRIHVRPILPTMRMDNSSRSPIDSTLVSAPSLFPADPSTSMYSLSSPLLHLSSHLSSSRLLFRSLRCFIRSLK